MRKSELDLSVVRPRDRFAFFESATRHWAAIQPIHGVADHSAAWRMWELQRLIVSDAQCAPTRFDRISQRYPTYDNEFVLIQTYLDGFSDVRVSDQIVRTEKGCVYLFDKSRRFSSVCHGARTRGVVIPHDVIGYDPSVHPAIVTVPYSSPPGRVLAHTLSTLPARLEAVAAADTGPLARDIAEVFRALLLARTERVGADAIRRARRIAIENFIETRLQAPNLNVSSICAVFGLSRASLYRHFPEAGGVASYIRHRRLMAAFHDLTSVGPTRGVVRDVCDRWGFYDTAHFHRVFRNWFELSPTEAVTLPRPRIAEAVAPGELLRAWQSRLRVGSPA